MHLEIFVVEAARLGAEDIVPPKKSSFRKTDDMQSNRIILLENTQLLITRCVVGYHTHHLGY